MKNLFIIDYETTGLNPYYNEPIEIAIKKYGIKDYYASVIVPSFNGINYNYIPKHITKITGITDQDIITKGKDYNIVTYEVISYIEDHAEEGPIYIIAHNGTMFDFLFFRKMIDEYNKSEGIKTRKKSLNMDMIHRFEYIDTLLMARLLLRDETLKQPNLCKKYNINNLSEHRSLGDIQALEKLYTIICEQLSYLHKKDKNHYLMNPSNIILRTYLPI